MHIEKVKQFERRVEVFESYLKGVVLVDSMPLKVEYRHCPEAVPFDGRLDGPYEAISEGTRWGGEWESAWFRFSGEVPSEWKGLDVAARIDLGGESLVFGPDGCPMYGLTDGSVFDCDFRKDIYRLFSPCAGGEKVDFYVEAAANQLFGIERHGDPKSSDLKIHGHYDAVFKHGKLCVFDTAVWSLWLDFRVLRSLMGKLPEKSVRRARIVRGLNLAIDAYGNDRCKVHAALAETKKLFDTRPNDSDMTVVAVGHAHIDTGWLWPVKESIRKCARTFASQIALLEKYPDYVFGASQAQHYLFMKEHYPSLYEKIRKYVSEGRWEIQGGTWVEHDCNVIGGEAMIRQFVHGKNFYKDEFGVDVRNLWLPDVFGYSAAMPQILKKCGVDFFLTQKMSWSQFNKFPHHTFNWRGIDGTVIVTHFPPENTYNSSLDPGTLIVGQENFLEKDLFDEYMSLFGIGDGGGGPSEEYVERGIRAKSLEGCPKLKFGRADEFFEGVLEKGAELDFWEGELYLELHRATYTTQAMAKRGNRMLENMLRRTEFICSAMPPGKYPKKTLDRIWKILLINQFHDIIPGSSIHTVYETAERQYAECIASCRDLENGAAEEVLVKDDGSMTFFNCLDYNYTRAVMLPESWGVSGAVGSDGHEIAVQQENDRSVAFVEIPACGFATVKKSGEAQKASPGKSLVLENELVRYEFADNGEIILALDKETGNPILENGAKGNVFTLYIDTPNAYDAWDIDFFYERQKEVVSASSLKAEALCDGKIRKGLRFELGIGKSTIKQRVYLESNSKRLDFELKINWDEMHRMLRVEFPVNVRAQEFSSDIQYGYAKRPAHRNTSWDMARFETCAHRYVDLSDADYGVALLNDCKYGHKVFGNVIDLNILRSPTEPDPVADIGTHKLAYSLLPHTGSLTESDVMKEAAMLNIKPAAFEGLAAKGATLLPVSLHSDGLKLEMMKRAEKDDSIIFRIVETHGSCSKGEMHILIPGATVCETDMLEWNDKAAIKTEKNMISLEFSPFEIRTYRIKT